MESKDLYTTVSTITLQPNATITLAPGACIKGGGTADGGYIESRTDGNVYDWQLPASGWSDNLLRATHPQEMQAVPQITPDIVALDDESKALLRRVAEALEAMVPAKRKPRTRKG